MKYVAIIFLCLTVGNIYGQKTLITKSSTTSFYSHAPLEDIEAINSQTTAALDLAKKEIVVKMLIKHFTFENALMQEHFNENYMESEKFPSSIFKGSFNSAQDVDLNVDGTYEVEVVGEITIRGIQKPVNCMATMIVKDRTLKATTKFVLKPKDFNIDIPSVVVKNIAEEIEITSELVFK